MPKDIHEKLIKEICKERETIPSILKLLNNKHDLDKITNNKLK